jgi:hypothetical protein
MIISEITEDGRIRHYSDLNYCIRQVETGIIYYDAVDVIPCKYTYEETDIPIEPLEEPELEVFENPQEE